MCICVYKTSSITSYLFSLFGVHTVRSVRPLLPLENPKLILHSVDVRFDLLVVFIKLAEKSLAFFQMPFLELRIEEVLLGFVSKNKN